MERYRNYIDKNILDFSSSTQYQLSNSNDSSVYMKSTNENIPAQLISRPEIEFALNNVDASSIIYTGAGISKAAGIKTCEELYETLYIKSDINELVESYIEKHDYILAQYRMFCMRLEIGKPTFAHIAISEIESRTGCVIISENLDFLHQKSGVLPQNPFDNFDELKMMVPNIVVFLGVGDPMCSALFDYWYKRGAVFYSINSKYHESNVPIHLYIDDVQIFFGEMYDTKNHQI